MQTDPTGGDTAYEFPQNQVLTSSGVLQPCACGAMPWYTFGVVSYVGCSRCGRRTPEYPTRNEAVDAWNRGKYED